MNEIDVSKCKYKYKDDCFLYQVDCEDYSDCDYRQFQQLKQENEELSKKIKAITDTSYELSIKNLQLEQKLEKIKEICKNQDILRGRQALATKILQIIRGAK